MEINTASRLMRIVTFVLFCVYTNVYAQTSTSIPLQEKFFEHIQFKKIAANQFSFSDSVLHVDVNQSASLLMMPFDSIKTIHDVQFEWKVKGELRIRDAKHENQRDGDDAIFKLGLLLKSNDAFINPFVPLWLQKVRSALKFTSTDMIYLVANAKHDAGQQWLSPYNSHVKMIAVGSHLNNMGWNQASYQFNQPVKVVGLWLMADGDDTHSQFTTEVKNIHLLP